MSLKFRARRAAQLAAGLVAFAVVLGAQTAPAFAAERPTNPHAERHDRDKHQRDADHKAEHDGDHKERDAKDHKKVKDHRKAEDPKEAGDRKKAKNNKKAKDRKKAKGHKKAKLREKAKDRDKLEPDGDRERRKRAKAGVATARQPVHPSAISHTVNGGTVTVNFTAGASTYYRFRVVPEGSECGPVTGSPCVINTVGLGSWNLHYYMSTDPTIQGSGPFAAPGPVVVDPYATVTGASVSGDAVTISWTLPSQTAENFVFGLDSNNYACETGYNTSGSCTVTNVPPGQHTVSYRYSDSDAVNTSTTVTIAVPTPTGLTLERRIRGLLVKWTGPSTGQIDRFVATARPSTGSGDSRHCTYSLARNGLECEIEALEFRPYVVTLVAEYDDAVSAPLTMTATPLPEVPDTPGDVQGRVVGVNDVEVSWNQVFSLRGLAIRYVVSLAGAAPTRTCQATGPALLATAQQQPSRISCTISRLSVGTPYRIAVVAIGDVESDTALGGTVSLPVPPASEPPATVPDSNFRMDAEVEGGASEPTAGSEITVSGVGFLPGSLVVISLYSAPRQLGTATVRTNGSFVRRVQVPENYAGQHTFVASGLDANGDVRYLTLPVNIGASGPQLPETGTSLPMLVLLGFGLVGAGGVAVYGARPRRPLRRPLPGGPVAA
jgi:LPXTG-motif cell wall-anchored protein